MKILTNLKEYSTEDLIKIHEETLDKMDKLKERLNSIVSGAMFVQLGISRDREAYADEGSVRLLRNESSNCSCYAGY